MAHQHADAAGIDGRDFFEVEYDFGIALAQEFVHGGIQAIESRTHAQAAFERDDLDAIHCFRINIQRRNPLAAEVTASKPH